jgi:hypothetical protein
MKSLDEVSPATEMRASHTGAAHHPATEATATDEASTAVETATADVNAAATASPAAVRRGRYGRDSDRR